MGVQRVACYVRMRDGNVVLEEVTASSGRHVFAVYPTSHLGVRLAPFLDPAGRAGLLNDVVHT
jgi:hypothetical protein